MSASTSSVTSARPASASLRIPGAALLPMTAAAASPAPIVAAAAAAVALDDSFAPARPPAGGPARQASPLAAERRRQALRARSGKSAATTSTSLRPEAQALRQRLQAHVRSVVDMQDAPMRNHHITQDYHDLSLAMRRVIGGVDINWATMATWASRRAGVSIRKEDAPFLSKALGLLGPLVTGAVDQVTDRVAGAVAVGNRKVYAEIAPCYVDFITAFGGLEQPDPARLEEFRRTFRSGPVETGGQDLLREAFTNYYHAKFEKDPDRKAELMLLANAQIGVHEQTRLQPYIAAAIPPLAEKLITRHVFTLPIPSEELRLGKDVPRIRGEMFPEPLRTIESPEAREILSRWDRTPDTTRGSAAEDWSRLSDRMSYILDLFRSRQQDPLLWNRPLTLSVTERLGGSVGQILGD
jgi:hypothetical protein